jgi:hypothetical protein
MSVCGRTAPASEGVSTAQRYRIDAGDASYSAIH